MLRYDIQRRHGFVFSHEYERPEEVIQARLKISRIFTRMKVPRARNVRKMPGDWQCDF